MVQIATIPMAPGLAPSSCHQDSEMLQAAVLEMVPRLTGERKNQALVSMEAALAAAEEAAALDKVVDEAAFAGYNQNLAFQAAVEVKRAQLNQAREQSVQEMHALCMQECFYRAWSTLSTQESSAPAPISTLMAPGVMGVPTTISERAQKPMKVCLSKCVDQTENTNSRKGSKAGGKAPAKGAKEDCQKKLQTLATILQDLCQEDSQCILVVRRINKLGFKSPRKLSTYFSSFGQVQRVSVVQSAAWQSRDNRSWSRRRPSSLGFVLMRLPSEVEAVLSQGPELVIDNVPVTVESFDRTAEISEANHVDPDGEHSPKAASEGRPALAKSGRLSSKNFLSAAMSTTTTVPSSSDHSVDGLSEDSNDEN